LSTVPVRANSTPGGVVVAEIVALTTKVSSSKHLPSVNVPDAAGSAQVVWSGRCTRKVRSPLTPTPTWPVSPAMLNETIPDLTMSSAPPCTAGRLTSRPKEVPPRIGSVPVTTSGPSTVTPTFARASSTSPSRVIEALTLRP
jgi:hypothetical protein